MAAVLGPRGQGEEWEGQRQPRCCTGPPQTAPRSACGAGGEPGPPCRLLAAAAGRTKTGSARGRLTEAERAARADTLRARCLETPRRRQTLSWVCQSRDQEGGLSGRGQHLSRMQRGLRTAKPRQAPPQGPSEMAGRTGPRQRPSPAVTRAPAIAPTAPNTCPATPPPRFLSDNINFAAETHATA